MPYTTSLYSKAYGRHGESQSTAHKRRITSSP